MLKIKTQIVLVLWALLVCINVADGAPFLWLLGYEGRGNRRGKAVRDNFNVGDLCRVNNPSPWTATGQFSDPNCPP